MAWQFESLVQLGSITEGPAWDGSALLFSDIRNSRTMRYDPASGEVSVYREEPARPTGSTSMATVASTAAPAATAQSCASKPDGTKTVICDRFEGKRLNSPNDLAIDKLGRIWFTDPRYGDYRDDMELDHESVLRLDPQADGSWTVQRMTFDTTSPNGLLVTPDMKTLYVAQSKYGDGQLRELRAYPIRDDGTLGAYEVLHNFYPHRGIDGMCLDSDGNIVATAGWEVSGPGGMIYVFAPNGRVLETHPVPVDRPTNCTFGGDDLSVLYVTSIDGQLLRAQTDRQGLALYS